MFVVPELLLIACTLTVSTGGLYSSQLDGLEAELQAEGGPAEILVVADRHQHWIVRSFQSRWTLTWTDDRTRFQSGDLSAAQWSSLQKLFTPDPGPMLKEVSGECPWGCGNHGLIGRLRSGLTQFTAWRPCESERLNDFLTTFQALLPEKQEATYPSLEKTEGFGHLVATDGEIDAVCVIDATPAYLAFDETWRDPQGRIISPDRVPSACSVDREPTESLSPDSDWRVKSLCRQDPERTCRLVLRHKTTLEVAPLDTEPHSGFRIYPEVPGRDDVLVVALDYSEGLRETTYLVNPVSGAVSRAPAHGDAIAAVYPWVFARGSNRRFPQASQVVQNGWIVPAREVPESDDHGLRIVRIDFDEFSLEVLADYPEFSTLMLDTEQLWVDETKNVAYISYRGNDLLRVPFNRVATESP